MKHKVNELEGSLLDAAVAKAEGAPGPGWYREKSGAWVRKGDRVIFSPSTEWVVGGPIIEREELTLIAGGGWVAYIKPEWSGSELVGHAGMGDGPTPLVAAMRAYVASRFGDEVELPG